MTEHALDVKTKLKIIHAACKDYQDKLNELFRLKKEVDQTKNAIVSLWKYLDICPVCRGAEKYFQRSCAEDEGEIRPCKCCKGTGRFPEGGVPEIYRDRMFATVTVTTSASTAFEKGDSQ